MTNEDEQKLIQFSIDGDLDAFNRLVEMYQDAVFSVTLRMIRNHATAEDVTQETFVSAFRSIRSYRGGNFRAWLLRIARNNTYDHLRKVKRRPEVSIDEDIVTFSETVESSERGPEEWALAEELKQAITDGLGELPPDQRMAVVLVDIEGYRYEEAAEVMGVSVGTVKSRLNRARTRLRDILQARPELLPASMRL